MNQVPLELVHAASLVKPTMEAAFGRCAAHDTASVASQKIHHAWTETKQYQHAQLGILHLRELQVATTKPTFLHGP